MVTKPPSLPTPTPTPSSPNSLRILTSSDIDVLLSTLDPTQALESQAKVFRGFSAPTQPSSSSSQTQTQTIADIQSPPRITLQSPSITSLFMPSRIPKKMAVKIVSIPTDGGEGLPATTVVLDEVSGRVKGIVNARKLTALRNACGSALFLQSFPQKEPPKSLLLFGTGAQSQSQSHATLFLNLYPSITSVKFLCRRSTPRSASLLTTMSTLFPTIKITVEDTSTPSLTSDVPTAVHNADIIVTATSSTVPLFNSVDVRSGSRIILIGSYKPHMHEVEGELVKRAGRVVVDSREACEREAGELIGVGLKGSWRKETFSVIAQYTNPMTIDSYSILIPYTIAIISLTLLQAQLVFSIAQYAYRNGLDSILNKQFWEEGTGRWTRGVRLETNRDEEMMGSGNGYGYECCDEKVLEGRVVSIMV